MGESGMLAGVVADGAGSVSIQTAAPEGVDVMVSITREIHRDRGGRCCPGQGWHRDRGSYGSGKLRVSMTGQ